MLKGCHLCELFSRTPPVLCFMRARRAVLLTTVISCTDLLWYFSQSQLLLIKLHFSVVFPFLILLFGGITLFLSIDLSINNYFLTSWEDIIKPRIFVHLLLVFPGFKASHGLCPKAVFTSWVPAARPVGLKPIVLSLSGSAGCWVVRPGTGFAGAGTSLLKAGGKRARVGLTLPVSSWNTN